MMIKTYQKKGIWYACWLDLDGKKLGIATHDLERDKAIYLLGLNMGANPSMFTRPMGDYFDMAYERSALPLLG
jgi:hypothetical protein